MSHARVAYLVNRYPDFSHSFIRREIAALEALGTPISIFTIRRPRSGLVDPADRREAARVHVLLAAGIATLSRDVLRTAWTHPRRFARASSLMFFFLRRAPHRVVAHLAYLVEACHLFQRLRSRPSDLVHAHFGTNPATVALLVRALGGPPVILTIHGPEEFETAARIGLTAKVAGAAATIAVCEQGAEQLRRGLPPHRRASVHVVHCSVDDEHLRDPSPVPPAPARIVCVGRLCPQKDQLLLLEALRRLAVAGVPCSLDLVGDGPWRRSLQGFVERHALQERVTFHGWQPGSQVARLLRASRVLVLASRAEGLPLAIMESFAAGRPVVATAVGGVPELVDAGTGWLVPPGDAAGLAEAIRAALAATDETILAMGARGRARVEAGFTSALIAKALKVVHATVLAVSATGQPDRG